MMGDSVAHMIYGCVKKIPMNVFVCMCLKKIYIYILGFLLCFDKIFLTPT